MKERPILFSGDMVRAILDGRKTQTRRILKSQAAKDCLIYHRPDGLYIWTTCGGVGVGLPFKCPYGRIGDRLWVRETWMCSTYDNYGQGPETRIFFYRADQWTEDDFIEWEKSNGKFPPTKWKPSIFMPRKASRITLEITNVRFERLQDIDDEQSGKEGIRYFKYKGPYCDPGKLIFKQLWESINGTDSWDANPWVWVIEFRQI